MKRSELKRLIQTAYDPGISTRKTAFLRSYQDRRLHWGCLLSLQCSYMCPQLILLGGYALAILVAAASHVDEAMARLLSALMPVVALVAMTGLGKSSRYGMVELEAASRLSLRMVNLLRLAILGIAGVTLMLVMAWTVKLTTGTDCLCSFALAGIPYLLTSFLCMFLVRRWHSPKNIYGCVAIALGVSLLTLGGTKSLLSSAILLSRGFMGAVLLLSVLLSVSEAFRFIKESEVFQWNLC